MLDETSSILGSAVSASFIVFSTKIMEIFSQKNAFSSIEYVNYSDEIHRLFNILL